MGTHPDLRPLDLMVEEEASPDGSDHAQHVTLDDVATPPAARSPVQARPAAAVPAAPATTLVALFPAAGGPTPVPPAPAAGPAPAPPAPADGTIGPDTRGSGGELPGTPEEARAHVAKLVIAHGEAGARARVERAIVSQGLMLAFMQPGARREAVQRAALVRAELDRVAAENAALRERFGIEAGRMAEQVLADSESEIAAALAGYGVRATPEWRDVVTSVLWKTGDLDLAVDTALRLGKPGSDAAARAGAEGGQDLVRAARELLALQARLGGWMKQKEELSQRIYRKQHPSHHQAGPAAPRAQPDVIADYLRSSQPEEQPGALPAPARPELTNDLRLSPDEQQAYVDAKIRLARHELLARWLAHEQAHPILAAFRDADGQPAGLERLAGAGAKPVRVVLRRALPKLVDNRKTRRALRDGALSPWALPRVVTLAQAGLGIAPGTLQARVVADEARDHASGNTMAVAAVGLGLAVLAAVPTGGGSLTLGAELSGLALEAYLAVDSIERHQIGESAANTHLDRARTLAAEEPSLGWLAVDLLGASVGMGMAVKAMREAASLRHAALAGSVAPEAIARLDKLGNVHGLGAIGSRIAREARESAGRAGTGAVGLAADALAGAHLGTLEQRLGVRVVADAGLGDGVRIQLGADGVRVLHVSVGPQARVADVLVHGDVVRRMERYRGLAGGLRRLGERMRGWLGGASGVNPVPPGTLGHEAWHEVEKHVALLEVRHARLAGGVLDDAASRRVRQEISVLEGRLSEYREVVEDALESGVYVPGRGWVAQDPIGKTTRRAVEQGWPLPETGAKHHFYRESSRTPSGLEMPVKAGAPEGTPRYRPEAGEAGEPTGRLRHAGEKQPTPKFAATDTPADVLAALCGPGNGKSFGAWLEVLERNGMAGRDEILAVITRTEYAKKTHDSVRKKLKDHFRPRLLARLHDPRVPDAESWRLMRALTDDLNNADMGNLVHQWYVRRHAPGASNRARVTPEQAAEKEVILARSRAARLRGGQRDRRDQVGRAQARQGRAAQAKRDGRDGGQERHDHRRAGRAPRGGRAVRVHQTGGRAGERGAVRASLERQGQKAGNPAPARVQCQGRVADHCQQRGAPRLAPLAGAVGIRHEHEGVYLGPGSGATLERGAGAASLHQPGSHGHRSGRQGAKAHGGLARALGAEVQERCRGVLGTQTRVLAGGCRPVRVVPSRRRSGALQRAVSGALRPAVPGRRA